MGIFTRIIEAHRAAGREKQDEEKNRARLEAAASLSKKIGALRIADEDVRKRIPALAYEADRYIAACRRSEGACYDPLTLEGLRSALAALNVFQKAANDEKAETLFAAPLKGGPELQNRTGGAAAQAAAPGLKEKTLKILDDAVFLFKNQNEAFRAGDADAAVLDLKEV